jgi:Pro-kumamolisin, activation domain/Bacterial Ig-like domain (group 3)
MLPSATFVARQEERMRKPLLLGVLVGLALTVSAQNPPDAASFTSNTFVRPLISHAVDEKITTILKGNIHLLARPQFDIGGAPPNLALQRMLLVLKRSPEQDTALKTLLDQQQDRSSPNFHRWLTPDEFGRAFGPSDQDIQVVTSWLQTHGFQINRVTRGRTMIEFSGNHSQLQQTFHTSIHQYAVNGELHWANSSDPQIPAALAPVVAGVHTLHNFKKQPMLVRTNQQFAINRNAGTLPTITGTGGQHFLGPGDFNKIYTVPPTLTGAGASIAIVGRSNIHSQDLQDFASIFGVPSAIPSVVLNGEDPGDLGDGGDPSGQNEEAEAVLDNTWSSALAPHALVKFVVSASTDTTDGVDLSELYIIDNNLADIMTESFGSCEAFFSNTEAQGVEFLAEQAAAQGITYTLSTGDTGSAGCARGSTIGTTAISALASTRFNVAVGGTQFNDTANPAKYWNPSQNAIATALSYIPENVWNESTATSLAATGGGASAIFTKPSWQSALTPNDGARDIPDVSLAAAGHTPFLICFEQSCQQGFVDGIAGTSASAPSFAAMMALIVEETGSRQGQANYVLYKLAATQSGLTTCNGSSTTTLPASNCIFNDVTSGTNAVTGVAGFAAAKGYDRATGLGSVNVTNLANAWSTAEGAFKGTVTTLGLSPSPVNITHGQSVNVQIGVAPSGTGTGTPSGDVALLRNAATGAGIASFPLNAGLVNGQITQLLPGGNYNVIAHYSGDGIFGSSDSTPVAVNVSAETTSLTASAQTFDASGHLVNLAGGSTTYGNPIYLKADVQGLSNQGTATGTIDFTDGPASSLATAAINSQGDASTAQGLFAVSAGSHSVVAKYLGDASFSAASSAAIPFTVTKAPTTVGIQANPASVNVGGSVSLTATVSTSSGGNAPGGTVTFFSASTQLGSPVAVTSQTPGSGSIQSGAFSPASAAFVLSSATPPAGKSSITATYNADTNYAGSTSAAVTVNVADFTLSGSPTAVTVSRGKSGSSTLTVTGIQPGFGGTVSFAPASCSGLPSLATCSFSVASVANAGTTVLSIATTAQSAALSGSQVRLGLWATTLGIFGGVFLLGSSSRRKWNRLFAFVAFSACLTIAGCGGSKSSTPVVTNPGTPVGTFSVVVTGTSSSGATSSVPITLTVQ